MALPQITNHIIATGANVQVRASKTNESSHDFIIGLASNVSFQESFQLQEATVLGYFGPVSIDPQGYNCTITIGAFVPSKLKIDVYTTGIGKGILEDVPSRQDFFTGGMTFAYLDFYNALSGGKVLAAFKGVIISDAGMTIEGNTYVKANIQLRALERIKFSL